MQYFGHNPVHQEIKTINPPKGNKFLLFPVNPLQKKESTNYRKYFIFYILLVSKILRRKFEKEGYYVKLVR